MKRYKSIIMYVVIYTIYFCFLWLACVSPTEPSFPASFIDSKVQVFGSGIVGTTLKLTVQAQGTEPITYQWFKDDKEIHEGTSDTFTIESLQLVDKGEYKCQISNALGQETSSPHTLTVKAPPLIKPIPDQIISKGGTFNPIELDNYINDEDHDAAKIAWVTNSDYTNIIITISDNRVATVEPKNSDWIGYEKRMFRTTDPDDLKDSIYVTFSVTDGHPPVVSTIPDQKIKMGETFTDITLDTYVEDRDHPDDEIDWTTSIPNNLSISISKERIVSIKINDENWWGDEQVYFTATDPDGLHNTTVTTFTVINGKAPVISDIPDQTITQGDSFKAIDLDDYVEDPDNNDEEMVWKSSSTTNIKVTIDNERVATIIANDPNWIGKEKIVFTVTDPDGLSDKDEATFTLISGNAAPVVTDIKDQTIKKGNLFVPIKLDDFVTDSDNHDSTIVWTTSPTSEITITIDSDRQATIEVKDQNWIGSESVEFTATDPGGLKDVNSVTFTVTDYDPPIVDDIPDETIDEGGTFTEIKLDDFVEDKDNPDDEISWTSSQTENLEVTISSDRIASIVVKDIEWNGSESVTFTATDPTNLSNADNVTFTVKAVNDAPIVTTIPNQTIKEGGNFETINLNDYVEDKDNPDDEISWTFSSTTNLTIAISDENKATITVNDPEWNGKETVTFTATDPQGLHGKCQTDFAVTGENDPPIVSDMKDQSIDEGGAFSIINLDDFVHDADNSDDQISWTYSTTTYLNVSISADRRVTITVKDKEWNGSEMVTFTATDPTNLANSGKVTFTVNPVNDPPSITSNAPTSATEDVEYTYDPQVSDNDIGDLHTWSFTQNPSGMTIDVNTGHISWTPGEGVTGENVKLKVTDNGNPPLVDEQSFYINVIPVNDPPVIKSNAIESATEDLEYRYDPFAEDPENGILTWSLSEYPSGMSISSTTGSIRWTPLEGVTFANVVLKVTDNGSPQGIDEQSFRISVTPVNDPPTITTTPPTVGTEDKRYSYSPRATDPENGTLTWSLRDNPGGMTINNSTGAISWTPGEGVTQVNVTVRVTDNGSPNEYDEQTYQISVTPVNDPPVFSNIPDKTINSGPQFPNLDLKNYVSDPDSPTLTFGWIDVGGDNVPNIREFNEVTGIVEFWYKVGMVGKHTFKFSVTDGEETAYSNNVTYQVNPPQK